MGIGTLGLKSNQARNGACGRFIALGALSGVTAPAGQVILLVFGWKSMSFEAVLGYFGVGPAWMSAD